jgi:hypothetical protein
MYASGRNVSVIARCDGTQAWTLYSCPLSARCVSWDGKRWSKKVCKATAQSTSLPTPTVTCVCNQFTTFSATADAVTSSSFATLSTSSVRHDTGKQRSWGLVMLVVSFYMCLALGLIVLRWRRTHESFGYLAYVWKPYAYAMLDIAWSQTSQFTGPCSSSGTYLHTPCRSSRFL